MDYDWVFIKKLFVNFLIHLCWMCFVLSFSFMCEDFPNGVRSNIGFWYFENGWFSIPITAIIFITLIIVAYKKKPCQELPQKIIYWVFSTVQTLAILYFTFGWLFENY